MGNQPQIQCIAAQSLFTTNGQLPATGCQSEEVVSGTAPLYGTFQLALNTSHHPVINYQGQTLSLPISHNAYGNVSQSGGDGTSMQELLEGMDNIGQVVNEHTTSHGMTPLITTCFSTFEHPLLHAFSTLIFIRWRCHALR